MKLSDVYKGEVCNLEDGNGFHFELKDDGNTLYIAYFEDYHFCNDFEIELDLEAIV